MSDLVKMNENTELMSWMSEEDLNNVLPDIEVSKKPFLKISNGTSKVMKEGTIEGLQLGEFYNTQKAKRYGKNINLVFVGFQHVYVRRNTEDKFIEQVPFDIFTTMIKKNLVDQFPRFVDQSTGDYYIETINLFCLNADAIEDGGMILSLHKTMAPLGASIVKSINAKKVRMGDKLIKAPVYSTIWELSSGLCKGKKEDFFGITGYKEKGSITPDLALVCREAYREAQEVISNGSKVEIVDEV